MIKNYLLVAVRNFLRQRFYSWLNVIGLTTGLASALLIILWVREEISVNQFHTDLERIVKVYSNYSHAGAITTWNDTPGPLADYVRENLPGVQYAARTVSTHGQLIQHWEETFLEDGLYADLDLFDVFSFKILHGATPKSREDKSSLMISERLAIKLFRDANVISKPLKLGGKEMTIAGVFQDPPRNSSLTFDFVLPFEAYKEMMGDRYNWINFEFRLYLKLRDAAQGGHVQLALNKKFEDIVHAEGETDDIDFYLQPFADVYLQADFENGLPAGGKIDFVRIFSVVAVFILVIACINFTNMATARAIRRSREIGIRKVVGAQRTSLIIQFAGEAILISALAMIFALMLVYLLLPGFNLLIDKQIELKLFDPFLLTAAFGLVIVSGVLAGSYPAFVLSSFEPGIVLKGTMSGTSHGGGLRRMLVIFQFSLTVVLIISAIVVYRQINFILNKNLGFDRHGILSFEMSGSVFDQYDAFFEEMNKQNGIVNVSRSNESLVLVNNQTSSVKWSGKSDDNQQLFRVIQVDHLFQETMKLHLVEGRSFSKNFNDVNNYLVSRRAADEMGFANPVGEKISVWNNLEGTIVGVISDFHSQSLKGGIDPVILLCKPEWTNQVFVRFEANKTNEAVASMEAVYKKFSPEHPFVYKFMDDSFEELYKSEKVAGSLALSFTIIAIVISGLGLLGLTAYTTERRQKEIGIRKTLGASVSGLVVKMSTSFVKLSLIAFCLGCPVAYLAMDKFLSGYSYHTTLGWEVFIITGFLVIMITLIIVVYQVIKAARVNPVEVLRNE